MRWFKWFKWDGLNIFFVVQYNRCFKNFWGSAKIPLKMEKNCKDFESSIFLEAQKYYFAFESRLHSFFFFDFSKINIENNSVVLTLSNVVQFNVEIHNVVSTFLTVVNFNVDAHNVVSTLIWRCATSRRHIDLKATLNRRWNVCWVWRYFEDIWFF